MVDNGMKRAMSSRDMMIKAGKEIAKSVVVAKGAQVGAQRLGITALASSVGVAAWAGGLVMARNIHPQYLDPVSANQINRDPEFVMNCHIRLDTRDTIKMEDIVESFEFYLQHFARFRERVVVRQMLWPYWEPMDKFDITQHVVFDTAEKSHDDMQDVISLSLTQGMNPLLPLWKIMVFTNVTFQDGTRGNSMVFKYHHCMGDGFSLARTMFTLDTANALSPKKIVEAPARVHAPGDVGNMVGKFVGASTKLLGMKDDAPSSVKAASRLKPHDPRHACALTSRVPIKDIKAAAKMKGFTINDMVLGALSAALRTYQVMKEVPLVDPLAGLWVALRPLTEAFSTQDLNDIEEPGNRSLGCVYVRLPVVPECASVDRVQAVADEISQLKGSPEPLLAQQFMKLFGLMPTLITNSIWNAISNKISLSVSNLPGPPVGFKFCGAETHGFSVFVPPVGTISTFALITSLDDRITLSLAQDGLLFSKEDSKFICQQFDDELCQLVSSMQQSRL